ncbi:hypothetical protein PR048_003123 [Dryococelus australis]|uniref:HTH psq-type domain-containing protein n=1 Tax=Dryococelus australis TaxID=614101 RepID=A0ABQ9IPE2_9NEOP|nr:hypothetical protein PR048_003123 [Dryococelus australis]
MSLGTAADANIAAMGKKFQNIRAKWKTEDLQNALKNVKSGLPVAAASRQYNIPRRTLGDWLKRGDRHICDEKGIPQPFYTNKEGEDCFYDFVRRNNDILLRKAENLSYCMLMGFNNDISLKVYWNPAVDNFRRKNPGRTLGKLQFGNLFTEAWTQAATPKNAMSGFTATAIFPFIPQVIPETAFAPSDVSDRTPLQDRPKSSSATSSCTLETSTISATHTAPECRPAIYRPFHKRRGKIRKNNDGMHHGDCGLNYYDKYMNELWIQCVKTESDSREKLSRTASALPHRRFRDRIKIAVLSVETFSDSPEKILPLIIDCEADDDREYGAALESRAGETGDPRGNAPTSSIVRHDSHMRISEVSDLVGGERGNRSDTAAPLDKVLECQRSL